uniref:Uncharacterized protein n=1 Tax=Denticeps clupeoides TaxID=299321 RepID=A0AAY4BYV0_9TELE
MLTDVHLAVFANMLDGVRSCVITRDEGGMLRHAWLSHTSLCVCSSCRLVERGPPVMGFSSATSCKLCIIL